MLLGPLRTTGVWKPHLKKKNISSSRMRPKRVFSLEFDIRALENDGRLEAPLRIKKKEMAVVN